MTCHVCSGSPCFLICPMADPFGGDQELENADYEANACYDAVRERFAEMSDDCDDRYEDYLSKVDSIAHDFVRVERCEETPDGSIEACATDERLRQFVGKRDGMSHGWFLTDEECSRVREVIRALTLVPAIAAPVEAKAYDDELPW